MRGKFALLQQQSGQYNKIQLNYNKACNNKDQKHIYQVEQKYVKKN